MSRTLSSRLFQFSTVPLLFGGLLACSNPAPAEDPMEQDGLDMATVPPELDASVVPPTTCKPAALLKLPAPIVELRSPLPFTLEVEVSDGGDAKDAHPLKVVLAQADGTIIKTLIDAPQPLGRLPIDFTPALEKGLPTGPLELRAEVGCPTGVMGQASQSKATLYAVRLGATQLDVKDGEGGGRVPLMYHALDHRDSNYFPIPATLPVSSVEIPSGEAELDKPDGTPRTFPSKPWDDLASPPVDAMGAVIETGNTLPVSLRVGTQPDLVFTIGKTAAAMGKTQNSGLDAAGLPPIRLVVDGVAGSESSQVKEGGEVTIRLTSSPVPAIDRVDLPVTWHFEWKGESGYTKIAGAEQAVTLRFYGVLGNEQGTASPDLPWVAVVDGATRKIAGKATTAEDARAILVQHVYEEMGLSYDRRSGASRYTRYSGSGGWSVASFSLAEFLTRKRGKIVNCTDCASILSTYANMIGAKLHYAIIGWNFKLNPILGIGATDFGSPFDSGKMGFSYHAVTTHDATDTINDATLAVDGDMDPKVAPQTKLLVQNMTGDDYLDRLSPTFGTSTPVYQYEDQITHAK